MNLFWLRAAIVGAIALTTVPAAFGAAGAGLQLDGLLRRREWRLWLEQRQSYVQ
jgi:hypothetical protein